jgi:hypothetical protein
LAADEAEFLLPSCDEASFNQKFVQKSFKIFKTKKNNVIHENSVTAMVKELSQ